MDYVTMNILDNTMLSICREMGIVLMKTSYSTIFNEALDFTCGIASPRGEMLSAAEFCPAQIGGLPLLIAAVGFAIGFLAVQLAQGCLEPLAGIADRAPGGR